MNTTDELLASEASSLDDTLDTSCNNLQEQNNLQPNGQHNTPVKKDRSFLVAFFLLAIPIALQNVVFSLLNIADTFMVSRISGYAHINELSVEAVALSNRYLFINQVMLFALNGVCAVFAAQYFVKGERKNVAMALGFALLCALVISAIGVTITSFFSYQIFGVLSDNAELREIGPQFLFIVGFSVIPFSISIMLNGVLRSMKYAAPQLICSIITVLVNITLNAIFIFGLGLGLKWIALGTLFSRTLEALMFIGIYFITKNADLINPKNLLRITRDYIRRYTRITLPALGNEIAWSVGLTIYFFIFASMGDGVLAAVAIMQSMETLLVSMFIGVGAASSVVLSQLLGARKYDEAYDKARRVLFVAFIVGLVSGAVMLLTIPLVPIFFSEITPEATRFVQHLLALRGSTFFIKAINFTLFMGVMRSGGDTVFTMITEGLTIWTLAIPLLFVLGFWLGLPIVVVYAIVIFEELTKMTVLLLRYRSKRWMRTLTN